jgi:hypothetical protein
MARKKPSAKKQLPTWVSVVVIVVLLAVIAVWYSSRQGREAERDKGDITLEKGYYEKCKDINFVRNKVPGNALPGLVANKIIPKEWAEGNWVPYYDPKLSDK